MMGRYAEAVARRDWTGLDRDEWDWMTQAVGVASAIGDALSRPNPNRPIPARDATLSARWPDKAGVVLRVLTLAETISPRIRCYWLLAATGSPPYLSVIPSLYRIPSPSHLSVSFLLFFPFLSPLSVSFIRYLLPLI